MFTQGKKKNYLHRMLGKLRRITSIINISAMLKPWNEDNTQIALKFGGGIILSLNSLEIF